MTSRLRPRWLLASVVGAMLLLPPTALAERPATIDLAQGQRTMFVGRATRLVAARGAVNGAHRGDSAMPSRGKAARLTLRERVAGPSGRPEPTGARYMGPALADIDFTPPGD